MSSQFLPNLKLTKFSTKLTNMINSQTPTKEEEIEIESIYDSPQSEKLFCHSNKIQARKMTDLVCYEDETQELPAHSNYFDKQDYLIQRISYNSQNELDSAIRRYKRIQRWNDLVLDVNEFIIEPGCSLKILTKKFTKVPVEPSTYHLVSFIIKYLNQKSTETLCIEFDNLITYVDGSIHINAIAILKPIQTRTQFLDSLLSINNPQFCQMISCFRLRNLLDLETITTFDENLQLLQQTLINKLVE